MRLQSFIVMSHDLLSIDQSANLTELIMRNSTTNPIDSANLNGPFCDYVKVSTAKWVITVR